ncbi:MAG: alpha-1,2-fucosyltransferase [Bacteroidota bacterium]|nr:alpha-1,2-fucosyltransferase [Bacteroidota bacterium]
MLVVRLTSGTGNQLFQYAFALYLKERYQDEVYLDKSPYLYRYPDRKCTIDIVSDLSEIKDWRLYDQYRHIKYRLAKMLFSINPTTKHIRESALSFPKNNKLLYFDGYWQTDKYIRLITDPDRLFRPKETMPESIKNYQDDIRQTRSISLHVRRGDYFSQAHQPTFGVCDKEYYEKAIQQATEHLDSYKLFIFSDDPDWTTKHLHLPASSCFVKNDEINPFWYIYLMSLCQDNIISNSSFSWWGAYMNKQASKRVFAPLRWTLTSEKTLALDDWIKL